MTTTMSHPPAVPPRPARSQDKPPPIDSSAAPSAPPKIPPRPTRRLERTISDDRFAPSPLNEGFPAKKRNNNLNVEHAPNEPVERPGSVSIPSLGEEGAEYAALEEGFSAHGSHEVAQDPEQTRTVGGELKLHAPKPSLPVASAKQRVAAVTRIDSDRAASFGIGRANSEETPSLRKKPSTGALSSVGGGDVDDDHGIPEIGIRVPMYPNAGDVQAPSPAPQPLSPDASKKRHSRKPSGQHGDLPPGSYGLHGHGVVSTDRFDKAYYEKHPDALQREYSSPYHDRQNDFAMSSTELNQIIRDTASRGSGLATHDFHGTPSEEIGFQAHEVFANRVASPRASSTVPKSSLTSEVTPPNDNEEDVGTIHVDEPPRPSTARDSASPEASRENNYTAPILAEDEVAKDPPRSYELQPAVEPAPEAEEPTSRPASRHSNRPASAQIATPVIDFGFESTPLEDVREYEPLFDEDGKVIEKTQAHSSPSQNRASVPPRFPSKDVWEDAPSSAHQTAVVSTPDIQEQPHARARYFDVPARDGPTPAQAFAKRQEELAEKEAQRTQNFVPRGGEGAQHHQQQKQQSWLPLQPVHMSLETQRPTPTRGFPSRDVWEDAPESHMHQTTVSSDQTPESPVEQPDVPVRPAARAVPARPSIPERPRPKKTPSDEAPRPKPAPPSEKPKPQLPPRPVRTPSDGKDTHAVPKAKPAVPARPGGGKIAALQAGFMSDLNKRLKLGPQAPAPKKDDPAVDEDEKKLEQKAPLSDARKGRARGPQRRAPARSPAAAPAPARAEGPSLSFSAPQAIWSIDPGVDALSVYGGEEEKDREAAECVSSKDVSPEKDAPVIDVAEDGAPKGDDPSAAEPIGEEAQAEAAIHDSKKSEPLDIPVDEPASHDTASAAEPPEETMPKGDRLGDLLSPPAAEAAESEDDPSEKPADPAEGEGKMLDDVPKGEADEPVDAAEFSEENRDAASKLWGEPR